VTTNVRAVPGREGPWTAQALFWPKLGGGGENANYWEPHDGRMRGIAGRNTPTVSSPSLATNQNFAAHRGPKKLNAFGFQRGRGRRADTSRVDQVMTRFRPHLGASFRGHRALAGLTVFFRVPNSPLPGGIACRSSGS